MADFTIIFLCIYFTVNFLLSLYLYNDLKRFHQAKKVITTGDTPELIDIHEKYKEFRRSDKLSYLRILLGLNLLFWPRIVLACLFTASLIVFLG
jgi:hypothetical protein